MHTAAVNGVNMLAWQSCLFRYHTLSQKQYESPHWNQACVTVEADATLMFICKEMLDIRTSRNSFYAEIPIILAKCRIWCSIWWISSWLSVQSRVTESDPVTPIYWTVCIFVCWNPDPVPFWRIKSSFSDFRIQIHQNGQRIRNYSVYTEHADQLTREQKTRTLRQEELKIMCIAKSTYYIYIVLPQLAS